MNDTRHWYEDFYATAPPAESAWYRAIEQWLSRHPDVGGPLLELGCGRAALLSRLAQSRRMPAGDIHGLEQSATAIESARDLLPNVRTGDIESKLPYADGSMNIVILAEVIEHLRDPERVLREVQRVLAPRGYFIVSFPNYVNLPWLGVRLLSAALNKPNWIVLQPIDHIFFYPTLRANIAKHGFQHVETAGTVFGPPILYRYETDSLARRLTKAGLAALSFHPMLVFNRT